MTPELTNLARAALLQVAQFVLVAVPANMELGVQTVASPRDGLVLADRLSPKRLVWCAP